MNKAQILGLSTVLSMTLIGSSISSVGAHMYQEQSQSSSQTSSFSSSYEGSNINSGTVEFKSSSKIKQSQSQGYGQRDDAWDRDYSRKNNRKNRRSTNGEVTVNWDHRGGTCHVRYTEGTVRNNTYNHSTWAACDEGKITISGLAPGKLYTFQVKKDVGEWSSPMKIKAS